MHLLLTLAYDGTRYFGWQKNRDLLTVELILEQACAQILGESPAIEGASRTDRGVHARGQLVKLSLKRDFDPVRLYRALNGILPDDISVLAVREVPAELHPSLDAISKEYHYHVCLDPVQLPIHAPYSWHLHRPISLSLIQEASQVLLGTHDFRALTTQDRESTVCTLHHIGIEPLPYNRLRLILRADRFLYKLGRALAGTLLNVGTGTLPLGQIRHLLATRDRRLGGITAPAHGLTLSHIALRSSCHYT